MKALEALWAEITSRTDYERCERPRGGRLRLDPVRKLLQRLGEPQHGAPALHVAGSKGKGSTCHFLERGLRAADFRTGLYLSPHLCHWSERVQVDGRPAPEDAWGRAFERVLGAAGGEETFFDLMTAAGFLIFAEAGCSAWIIEVGLGGRFDSTNVLDPLAAAVTSIEAEHVDVFGEDLRQIAVEKAGIFKPGAQLWSGLDSAHPARSILTSRASEVGEPLCELAGSAAGRADLPHPQPHMQRNFALARAILAGLGAADGAWLRAAQALDRVPPEELQIPGRFEIAQAPDGRPVVYDVAHTPDSVAAAVRAFRERFPGAGRGIVLGMRQDKRAPEIAELLGPVPPGETWFTAPAGDHPQSADPVDLARTFGARPLAEPGIPDGPEVVLVTGSTYLVGCLRAAQGALALS